MKISELIKELQEILNKEGDLDCYNSLDFELIEEIIVNKVHDHYLLIG